MGLLKPWHHPSCYGLHKRCRRTTHTCVPRVTGNVTSKMAAAHWHLISQLVYLQCTLWHVPFLINYLGKVWYSTLISNRRHFFIFLWAINPLDAKLFNFNFYPLEVVSRWREPQLHMSENYSDLTKWRSTYFKSCWLMSHFIFNIFKMWYLMCK